MRPWMKVLCVVLIVALAGTALLTAASFVVSLF
ncbi:MAG: hypothetical protein K0R62_8201 [Nonomuraea muscovyensis]|uniref:Uncharacterized protein n=1 Tax=Nonomuraea muscovyensis TaxID=1124761 RepID=A0A7X0BVQ8_9ACTN|nr:hypothetical protein [Nonomuraea muscovyensis]MDF2712549.1 hypothetical protein [Nonomuraea muscovyensis]